MEELLFDNKFNKYSLTDKKEYLKKLIKKNKLEDIIYTLILNNKNIDENFNLLESLFRTKIFKEKNKITLKELDSLIINIYVKENKTKELFKYLNNLDDNKKDKIYKYEIDNNTDFSKLKILKKYHKKDKNKKIDIVDNSKKVKATKRFLILMLFLIISYMFLGYCYSSIVYYNTHVYPNIYVDNILIENMNHQELKDLLLSKENKIKESITLKNDNNEFYYTYQELGYSVNTKEIEDNILSITKDINGYQKLYKILTRKEYKYDVNYTLDEEVYNKFLEDLRNKTNVTKKKESFRIINGNINYSKGVNGFTLDESSLKEEIYNSLINGNKEIILKGNVENVNNNLGSINKKVSTFTTYYNEAQGRAKNIRNATNRLNGTILYPGSTFSFYSVAGPYNGSRGYIFYGKDVGSGVCQVSTTIYNNVLKLNLPIVSRENHGDMVYYVDYGLDATVYGSSVDMKFRNNSNYPIYIEASAYGGTLTVNFWSNENIIPNGITYKPRVEKVSSLGFKTYLDTYKDGVKIDSKYLNSSYYLKGK